MNPHLRQIFVTIAGLIPCLSFAEVSFVCPEVASIASGSIAPDSIPSGYDGMISKTPIRLSGINMFDGPPEQGAALMPYSEKSTANKSGTVSIWKFEGNYPQGKFVSCDYANGIVRIVARTDDSVGSCVANTEIIKPYNTMKAYFDCTN